jgi:hypothetical protein
MTYYHIYIMKGLKRMRYMNEPRWKDTAKVVTRCHLESL